MSEKVFLLEPVANGNQSNNWMTFSQQSSHPIQQKVMGESKGQTYHWSHMTSRPTS